MFAYCVLLHEVYQGVLSPVFAYQGLAYRSPETSGYVLAVSAVLVTALFLPSRITRPSAFLQWGLFLFTALPGMLIAHYSPWLSAEDALGCSFAIAGSTLVVRVVAAASPTGLIRCRAAPWIWPALVAGAVLLYVVLVGVLGVPLQLHTFATVYDQRSVYVDRIAGVPVIGYLLPFQQNIANPLFMLRGLVERKPSWFCLGVAGQVLLYAAVAQKSILMTIPAVLAVYAAVRVRHRISTAALVLGLIVLGSAATLASALTHDIVWVSLIVRRFLVVPGLLVVAYMSLFQESPKTLFADIVEWVPYMYSERPAGFVGEHFIGAVDTNANASYLGHGYAALGVWGMLVEAVVVGVILALMDQASRGLSPAVVLPLMVGPVISFSSSNAFTIILSHGVLGAIVVLALLPRASRGPTAPGRPRTR